VLRTDDNDGSACSIADRIGDDDDRPAPSTWARTWGLTSLNGVGTGSPQATRLRAPGGCQGNLAAGEGSAAAALSEGRRIQLLQRVGGVRWLPGATVV
jgi:hypothetical protein